MMKKLLCLVSAALLAALILFVALFGAVKLLLSLDGFFESAFAACGSEEATGIALPELMDVHRLTAGYIRGGEESLYIVCERYDGPIEFYKADETAHLTDVRELYLRADALFPPACALLALTAAAALILRRRAIAQVLRASAMAAAAAAVLSAVFFDGAFTLFHRIFFPDGNWIFYPDISLMVRLYPEGVFIRCALFAAALLAAVCCIVLITASAVKRGKNE